MAKKTVRKKAAAKRAVALVPAKKRATKKKAAKKKRSGRALVKRQSEQATQLERKLQEVEDSLVLVSEGLSASKWPAKARAILRHPWEPAEVKIREDGIVYIPGISVAERLSAAFGPGAWGQKAVGEPQIDDDLKLVVQRWELWILGKKIGSALGECNWHKTNRQMSKGDAIEGCKTNALVRCAKHLVCQDHRKDLWNRDFIMQHGVYVVCQGRDGRVSKWRRKDDLPCQGEIGIDNRSPNREDYVQPTPVDLLVGSIGRRPQLAEKDVTPKTEPAPNRTQAVAVANDAPISTGARGQLFEAMKAHGRDPEDFKAFIKAQWGHGSTRCILHSQYAVCKAWIQEPFDADAPEPMTIDGEVVDAEG